MSKTMIPHRLPTRSAQAGMREPSRPLGQAATPAKQEGQCSGTQAKSLVSHFFRQISRGCFKEAQITAFDRVHGSQDALAAQGLSGVHPLQETHPVFADQEIQLAINKLHDPLRHAFLMHFQGHKITEIAAILCIPVELAWHRIQQARRELKYYLNHTLN